MYSRLYMYTDLQFHHSLFKDLYQARTLGKAKGKREYSHSKFRAVIELWLELITVAMVMPILYETFGSPTNPIWKP